MSSGDELDSGWVDGVVGGAAEQEQEEPAFVWRVKRPCDQSMDLQRDKRKQTQNEEDEQIDV